MLASHTLFDSPAKWEGKAGHMHVSCPRWRSSHRRWRLLVAMGLCKAHVKYHKYSISVRSQERSTGNNAMYAACSSPGNRPALLSAIGCVRHVPYT